jgi:predicted nucleotidyltransferase
VDRALAARAGLPPQALDVVARFLDEEAGRREHVVVYLSGAHAYGFPSPDSDVDLKCVHLAPAERFLGLLPPEPVVDRVEVIDGVEVDYTSNELGRALQGLLKGNGNFLERVLGLALVGSPAATALRELAPAYLSRRFEHHYRGFATQQLAALEAAPTVKRLLYVLRTLSTGVVLLRTGRLVVDLRETAAELGLRDVDALIARKRAGERVALDADERARWSPTIGSLFSALADATARSPLPVDPTGTAVLDAWLIALRRAGLR